MNSKWLLVFPPSDYYHQMMAALGRALKARGAETRMLPEAAPGQLNLRGWKSIQKAIAEYAPTDVLTINEPRLLEGAHPLRKQPVARIMGPDGKELQTLYKDTFRFLFPSSCRVHRWVQDLYVAEQNEDPRLTKDPEFTWVWVPGWEREWEGRLLLPAADEPEAWPGYQAPGGHEFDVGFVAFVPVRPDLRSMKGGQEALEHVVASLAASRNFASTWSNGQALLDAAEAATGFSPVPGHRSDLIFWIRSSVMRYVQRMTVVERLLEVAERRGWRVGLWGDGWPQVLAEKWVKAGIAKGHAPQKDLASIYRACKVNLHINGDTYYHTRTFEAIAAGGLVAAEALSGVSGLPLEIPTFKLETLEDDLGTWIQDDAARQARLERLRADWQAGHTWAHRADALLRRGA